MTDDQYQQVLSLRDEFLELNRQRGVTPDAHTLRSVDAFHLHQITGNFAETHNGQIIGLPYLQELNK